MANRLIGNLVLLWLAVLLFRVFLWESMASLITQLVGSNPVNWPASLFVGVTLFPVLYALLVWRRFWQHRDAYRSVAGVLYLLLSGAVIFSLSSICWTVAGSGRVFPFLLLCGFTLLELYFFASFVCVFIAFLFLRFGRKQMPD